MRCACAKGGSRLGGFTFAEVLAAMLFLAILIPAVVEGLALSNRAAIAAERSAVAVQLAEKQLNQLLLNNAWMTADLRGTFGADWPAYRWELTRGAWPVDDMTQLTLRVFFQVQGREQEIRLSTLVDDSAS